jgi:hypothetical protein
MPRPTKPMRQVSPQRLAEGLCLHGSTLNPGTGLTRTPLKTKPKADKPKFEKLPLPLAPGRERPAPKLAVPKTQKRPKDTGPSKTVRAWVWERLGRICVFPGCGQPGTQIHHRFGRGQGSDTRWFINHRSNLVPACWACNEDVDNQPNHYATKGMYLPEGYWPHEYAVNMSTLGWVAWDRDADDWVSVFDLNDWREADLAGVAV